MCLLFSSCVELVLGKEQGPPALQWQCLKEAGECLVVHRTQVGFGALDRVSVKLCSTLPRSPHHWWIQNKSQKSHLTEGLVLWIWVCTSKERVSISCIYAGICELSPQQSSGFKFRKASFKSTLEHLLSFVICFYGILVSRVKCPVKWVHQWTAVLKFLRISSPA